MSFFGPSLLTSAPPGMAKTIPAMVKTDISHEVSAMDIPMLTLKSPSMGTTFSWLSEMLMADRNRIRNMSPLFFISSPFVLILA